jgi:oligoendopeptidase F
MAENKETFSLSRWSLNDLFPAHDSKEMKSALKTVENQVAEFEKLREKLVPEISEKTFLDFLQRYEKMTRLAVRIGQYAGLWFSEDSQNQQAQTFQATVDQLSAELQNRTMFFSLWWKELDDKNAERLLKTSGEFEYFLQQIRNFKPYTLSEAEEKIVNIKNVTGMNALTNLYSSITDRYVFNVEVDGETKGMTRGELMKNVYSPDGDLRARAYQELYRVYGNDGPILGQMYQTMARDYYNENIDTRKFSSPISVRNLSNDIPDEVVETLLDVAQENARVFQRFFKFKAKLLGVDKLRRYDIYAPVAKSTKEYDYNTAVNLTLDAFNEFDPKLAQLSRKVFAEKHVDSEVRPGKRGGAFCSSGDPALSPYVLLSYNNGARDVQTLAHEFGHAIHAMLASHHNVFNFHSTLPLAETASTFGEMLLVDRMLAEESDPEVRRDILFSQVDDAYATIMRQIFFALFERDAHGMVQGGAAVDDLSAAYMKNLSTQFGDSLSVADEFKWEWVSIPHIYFYPFYVYSYAFGQLLVFSLYQQYKSEGDSFKPRYLELLSSGGSKSPEDILKKAGVNMRDAAFWQGGFDVVSNMVSELEKLSAK